MSIMRMLVSFGVYVVFALKSLRLRKTSIVNEHRITSYVKFPKVCLNKDVLKIAIIARADYRGKEVNFRNSDYRKAAYYQFCLWRYGKLGKGNRCVLPSCVVKLIRTRYPEPKGT